MLSNFLRLFFCLTVFTSAAPLQADILCQLKPATLQSFNEYAANVESQLERRWSGHAPFLEVDGNRSERDGVMHGDFAIRSVTGDDPLSVPEGLIHDWVGTVYIPKARPSEIISVLQDFNRHKRIYPDVIDSRLLSRNGDTLEGYWRLEQKHVLTVDFDVYQKVRYEQVAPDKWVCRAYTRQISEVEHAGERDEHRFPDGEGHGYLWRLYAYWSIESEGNGALAECRTISLSRDVPAMLGFVIKPFLHQMPRDSLAATLRDTKAAVAR
ncbi:MAG TPA: hypothetical protein VHZ07_21140 [Bryobacteraceae bacterium]|jgi:hypothetical protein|nr:hypothetical protein [Bryobacteraceae bacterium]